MQFSDEDLHRVRWVLDEVFGADNFVSLITVKKTGGLVTNFGLMDAIESGIVKVPRLPAQEYRTESRYVQGTADEAVMRLARAWKVSFDAHMRGGIR